MKKVLDDAAKEDRENRRPALRRPWFYYWPPVIAIIPACIADAIWGDSPIIISNTHGYFAIATIIAYGGALVCALRLAQHRKKLPYAIPFYLNLLFLFAPLITIAVMTTFGIDQL